MTKKLLAVVMALAVMLTACSMMAFAAETPTDVEAIVLELEANGAQGKMEDIPVDENGDVVVPEHAFTNPNFNFTGWNTVADGAGETYQPGDKLNLKETTTLYAMWVHKDAVIDELWVTYDANGGTGEVVDVFAPYISGGYAYTCYNDFQKAGATFIGWNTKADGTGTMFGEDEMFEIFENVTLYAIWEGGDEIIVDKTEDEEIVVSDTDTNPETGSASAVGAVVAGVVALGALVVLKKRG